MKFIYFFLSIVTRGPEETEAGQCDGWEGFGGGHRCRLPWWLTSIPSLSTLVGNAPKAELKWELTSINKLMKEREDTLIWAGNTTDAQSLLFLTCDQHMPVADLQGNPSITGKFLDAVRLALMNSGAHSGYNLPQRLGRWSPFTPIPGLSLGWYVQTLLHGLPLLGYRLATYLQCTIFFQKNDTLTRFWYTKSSHILISTSRRLHQIALIGVWGFIRHFHNFLAYACLLICVNFTKRFSEGNLILFMSSYF